MSTNDVPGSKSSNCDELAMGCWAEHEDGSLILVESTEGSRVIYSMFDTSTKPVTEYRDAMPEKDFKKHFTWDPKNKASVRWTWHDKTPFPWNKIIKNGSKDGPRLPSADDILSTAERVARSRRARGTKKSAEVSGQLKETKALAVRTVAERAATERGIRPAPFDAEAHAHKVEQVSPKARGVIGRIQAAISVLRHGQMK